MKPLFVFFGLWLLLLHLSCATIQTLSGGEKDKSPPRVLEIFPKKGTLQMKNKWVSITFDEFVVVDPSKISMVPFVPVQASVKGKRLLISWKEDLDSNTTYSISINQAVKDFTEGNMSPSLLYAFSTGSSIDSLMLHGNVQITPFVERIQDLSDVVCALYPATDSSSALFVRGKQYITTQADASGDFSFGYLPEDSFHVFAFEDLNSNALWDSTSETVGRFFGTLYTGEIDSHSIEIPLFPPHLKREVTGPKQQHRGHWSWWPGTYDSTQYKMYPSPDTVIMFSNSDTAHLYFEQPIDSLRIVCGDTQFVGYKARKATEIFPSKSDFPWIQGEKKEVQFPVFIGWPEESSESIELVSSTDRDTIEVNAYIVPPFSLHFDTENLTPGSYTLLDQDSLLISKSGDYLSLSSVGWKLESEEEYGSLHLSEIPSSSLVLLKNTKGETVRIQKVDSRGEIHFVHLKPDNYYVFRCDDADHDGQFTAGNIAYGVQPETVEELLKDFEVLQNWKYNLKYTTLKSRSHVE